MSGCALVDWWPKRVFALSWIVQVSEMLWSQLHESVQMMPCCLYVPAVLNLAIISIHQKPPTRPGRHSEIPMSQLRSLVGPAEYWPAPVEKYINLWDATGFVSGLFTTIGEAEKISSSYDEEICHYNYQVSLALNEECWKKLLLVNGE